MKTEPEAVLPKDIERRNFGLIEPEFSHALDPVQVETHSKSTRSETWHKFRPRGALFADSD